MDGKKWIRKEKKKWIDDACLLLHPFYIHYSPPPPPPFSGVDHKWCCFVLATCHVVLHRQPWLLMWCTPLLLLLLLLLLSFFLSLLKSIALLYTVRRTLRASTLRLVSRNNLAKAQQFPSSSSSSCHQLQPPRNKQNKTKILWDVVVVVALEIEMSHTKLHHHSVALWL